MRDDRLELRIGGTAYAGWKSIGVTRAMDCAAGTYNLGVTDRWAANQKPWEITPGDLADITIGGETVISGYVDIVDPEFDSGSHTISVQGRDKSADMIDCAAVHEPDEWRNISLLALAGILAKPFGISVSNDADIGQVIDLVKLQQGETAFEALTRYAKMRKMLVMPDGKGGVILTRTGSKRAAVELVHGENILSASGRLDYSERFSEYIVKGQGQFSSETDGEKEAHVLAKATDPGVKRYRPTIVIADTEANDATAQERATWQANTAIGKSINGKISVQGWRQTKGGELWAPNLLVRVRAPWMRIDGEMLIKQVTFVKNSDNGTTAELDIVSPQAFDPEPPSSKKAKKKKKGGGNPWEAALGDDEAGDE